MPSGSHPSTQAGASPPQGVVVGTAGHIDHGKTRLVRALTGIDTDRLPEEKSRGISIDLGFARLEKAPSDTNEPPPTVPPLDIVDVPGHERFIRNMVAGASGIDAVLLVIAADDGVMPQTREHLEIVRQLGIEHGLVALTKTDLVDGDSVAIRVEEVRQFLTGSQFETAPIVSVSVETGNGILELTTALVRLVEELRNRSSAEPDWFRLPIDRVFSVPGHGTVVTGTQRHGRLPSDRKLQRLPDGDLVRVRRVEHHGTVEAAADDRTELSGRARTGLNIADLAVTDLHRGQELVTPGVLKASSRWLVRVDVAVSESQPLSNRDHWRLHIGTAETVARLTVTDPSALTPGGSVIGELRTDQPLVAAWGDRFLLRRLSPAETVGGGVVLDPGLPERSRLRDEVDDAPQAFGSDPRQRLARLLARTDHPEAALADATWRAGIPRTEQVHLLDELRRADEVLRIGSGDGVELHRARLAELERILLKLFSAEQRRHHPRRFLSEPVLRSAWRTVTDAEVISAVLGHLLETGQLIRRGEGIGFPHAVVHFTDRQRQIRVAVLSALADDPPLRPRVRREIAESLRIPIDALATVLGLCADEGTLIPITDELHVLPGAIEEMRRGVRAVFETAETATLSDLRQAWEVTRKWAVPFGEWCDRQGWTIREGNLRRAGPDL